MADKIFELDEAEITTTQGLHKLCDHGRRASFQLATQLAIAAEDLQAALAEIQGNPLLLGVDSRARGRIVAAHLGHAADLEREAAIAFSRTWHSFARHFQAEIGHTAGAAKKPRRVFNFEA